MAAHTTTQRHAMDNRSAVVNNTFFRRPSGSQVPEERLLLQDLYKHLQAMLEHVLYSSGWESGSYKRCSRSEGCCSYQRGSKMILVHERAGDSGCKKQATPTRFTWAANRAFRRARARAREGPTWYRGRWRNADTLNALHGISNEQEDRNRPRKKQTHHHKQHSRDKRIRVLSINVGGMTTATWNELHAWLNIAEQDSFDVVTIQETHWKHNSEFNSGPWTVVGTGCAEGDRCAGVMTMVHKRLGNSQCVMHREILKGRMQHVRVLSGPTAIDIVNTYQHVRRTQYDQEKNMECRMRVWNALRKTVAQLPLRNTVVWCGDYNLAVNTCLPHVGT